MNIKVKHRTYTNNVHGFKYKEMMENAGKNMYGNKFISCKNTYTEHDKAHHSSSNSILSRHISDPVYIQELYRNITIHVSSPTSHSYACQHNGAAHTHEPDQSHWVRSPRERILMHWGQMAHQCTSHNKCWSMVERMGGNIHHRYIYLASGDMTRLRWGKIARKDLNLNKMAKAN